MNPSQPAPSAPAPMPATLPADSAPPGQRLRVAVLNRSFVSTGGGAERYSIALVEALAAQHEIHVFAHTIEHQVPGVHYHRLPGALRRPRWVNQLSFALTSWWATRRGFDVVHSHEMTWHGQVQTVHVLPVKYNLLHGRQGWARVLRYLKIVTSPRLLCYWMLESARFAMADGRCVVASSEPVRRILLQTYPDTKKNVAVIAPGVAVVPGPASPQDKLRARQQWKLPPGRCILFVANDFRKKGLPTLLEALGRLPGDCYLAVAGGTPHIAEFTAVAEKAGLRERVFFLGAVHDIQSLYAAADCLAHPTLEDTFAMVVLEAMAQGLPVVVSDRRFCGITELLRDGVNARVLQQAQDSAELAATLLQLLEPGAAREAMQRAAVEFASGYLWSHLAREQADIYARVAASGRRPP